MAALTKHAEEITLRRAANDAEIIYEYQYPPGNRRRVPEAATSAPDDTSSSREFVHRLIRECEERLAREMTFLCKLHEQGAGVVLDRLGLMTKGEAAKIAGRQATCEILDLDTYGGFMFRDGYLFISEHRIVEGLPKYGRTTENLLNGIINDRLAEHRMCD